MKKFLLAMDIGNVCVKIDHGLFPQQLGVEQTPETMKELLREFEFGHVATEKEFLDRAVKIFDSRFSAAKIKSAFNSIIIAPVPGMIELVNSFHKRNIQAVFFSDISITHLQKTREVFKAFKAVSGGVFSFECGNWKPSTEMLSAFESRYGIPDLYVDDRPDLIEAAKKHGWNAEVFTGAQDLQEKLPASS